MRSLQVAVAAFLSQPEESPERSRILQRIKARWGWYGVSLAARRAGLRRGQAKEMLGLRDPQGELGRLAHRECGWKVSRLGR